MLDKNLAPYMIRPGPQTFVTENYVSSPPALLVTDEQGAVWTLGMQYGREMGAQDPRGEFCFEVLRNGHRTGEFASRIERRGGRIRIFTQKGWKRLVSNTFI